MIGDLDKFYAQIIQFTRHLGQALHAPGIIIAKHFEKMLGNFAWKMAKGQQQSDTLQRATILKLKVLLG